MNSLVQQNAVREMAYWKWEQAGKPDGGAMNFWLESEREYLLDHPQSTLQNESQKVDEASEESFPASDPPAFNPSSI